MSNVCQTRGVCVAPGRRVQISRWLVVAYAGDEEMRMSHETICQSLFVQGRGALRKELWRCLRTGHAIRRPQGRAASHKGRIRDMVMISQRPAARFSSHRENSQVLGIAGVN